MIIGVREAIASHKAALLLLHLFTLLLFSSAFYLSTLLLFIPGKHRGHFSHPLPYPLCYSGYFGRGRKILGHFFGNISKN